MACAGSSTSNWAGFFSSHDALPFPSGGYGAHMGHNLYYDNPGRTWRAPRSTLIGHAFSVNHFEGFNWHYVPANTTDTHDGVVPPTQLMQMDWNLGLMLLNDLPIKMQSDTAGAYFGAGDDAHIYYDGTDLIINSFAVGTGGVVIPNNDQELWFGDNKEVATWFDGTNWNFDPTMNGVYDLFFRVNNTWGVKVSGANGQLLLQSTAPALNFVEIGFDDTNTQNVQFRQNNGIFELRDLTNGSNTTFMTFGLSVNGNGSSAQAYHFERDDLWFDNDNAGVVFGEQGDARIDFDGTSLRISGVQSHNIFAQGNLGVGDFQSPALPSFDLHVISGSVCLAVQDSAPTDANIGHGEVVPYLNQAGNTLNFRVRYDDGTYKTGSISLT
jgi:hypothetical protein